MDSFQHEKLDVYQKSIEFLVRAEELTRELPKGRAYLADQLRRAALSITLNVAEGAGEFAAADKARFYRMARRSATESAAILDASRVLALVQPQEIAVGRAALLRIVAMLTAMVLKRTGSGSDSGSGSGRDV